MAKAIIITNRMVRSAAFRVWIRGQDGATTERLAGEMGVSMQTMLKILSEAKRLGRVGYLRRLGVGGRWLSPDVLNELLAQRRDKIRVQQRNRARIRAASGRVNAHGYVADPPDWQPTRAFLAAGEEPPPATTAARTVFELRLVTNKTGE